MEYKLFLDTNALLNLQKEAFKESFVISQKTLEEIENIKESSRKDNEVKYKARQVAHLLDEHFGEYEVVTNNDDVKDIYSFPTVGNEAFIYVASKENRTYRWDNENSKYYCIGSDYSEIELINCGDSTI